MRPACDLVRVRDELLLRWGLATGEVFASPQNNLVMAVTRDDGSPAVLKISHALRETRSEISAVRIWHGLGAARLLASDAEKAALLLERVQPGQMLAHVEANADAATLVAVDLLRQLWRPAPADHNLNPLHSWCDAFERNRTRIVTGQSDFPEDLFRRADRARAELLASTTERVVLHGDLHHFNILTSTRAGWLTIDPKGLLGDRPFDVCQFLRNPVEVSVDVNRRRLAIFCAELGLDTERTRAWCLVHATLNALWDFETSKPFERDLEYVAHVLQL